MSGSIETMMNHLQETALNHVCVAGMNGDGFGSTHEMTRLNLIWVVTRMQVHVERYPSWGDVVEIDTWVAGSGKNSLRRDWIVRDYKTGYILAQATSTWVMMNRNTRKLSKFPEAVKNEISPYYLERTVIDQSHHEKLEKLGDDTAQYIHSNLTPRWTDLDVNRHVNNVKYIGWILEKQRLRELAMDEDVVVVIQAPTQEHGENIEYQVNDPMEEDDYANNTVEEVGTNILIQDTFNNDGMNDDDDQVDGVFDRPLIEMETNLFIKAPKQVFSVRYF